MMVGKLYQARESVPQILIPHSHVRRIEFGMDVEVVENIYPGRFGIFPMACEVKHCLVYVEQEFWPVTVPYPTQTLVIVFGVISESLIGYTPEEARQVQEGCVKAEDCARAILFPQPKDHYDLSYPLPMVPPPFRQI